ncbi:hypothetical protein EIN_052580 [Entamoeba invadens IP1]|uniref:hypothetical protein n=1 Tax=Entamoeba invadens IP1 TaxID=370355 RepID=UPI0002C3DAC8|nr:hypothetical protein EIN_052580 [Entamoeba invadens IP1]ELP93043.1 hypothetical protein EIN_052580 [Entamoeba invadens IP1]|eukprot:XP_004259814.1 hypothetical protein EIN_052580 [Entamoeba invadens IP1]
MTAEDLNEQLEVYLNILDVCYNPPKYKNNHKSAVTKISEEEWQTLIEDETTPSWSINLIFTKSDSEPYYTAKLEQTALSQFMAFDSFQKEMTETLKTFLEEVSPFYTLYTLLKEKVSEWREKHQTPTSVLDRLERFDEIPVIDTSQEIRTSKNYTECVTIWKDFHYNTIRISTTLNSFSLIEKIVEILKSTNSKYIEQYTTMRIYNDEVWIMRRSVGSSLFDDIFKMDDVATPIRQVLKGLQYLYVHGLFHGKITKNCVILSSTKSVVLADFCVLYLLDGNCFPETEQMSLLILKKDLCDLAALLENNLAGVNPSVQLTSFIQSLKTHESIELSSLIKSSGLIPSRSSCSTKFELDGEYEEVKSISKEIGFSAYYRQCDGQFYCFQDIDLSAMQTHVISEVKTRLSRFCQVHSKYFQYYFFSQPTLMVRMSISETPLCSFFQDTKQCSSKNTIREMYFKIVSAIYNLHKQNIGHGALSLKHIFIKDNDIRLAFFDLVSAQSVVVLKDISALKRLFLLFGCFFMQIPFPKETETDRTVLRMQSVFQETQNIMKAKTSEEIFSYVLCSDQKSRQILTTLLKQQPYLFTVSEYFTQQKLCCEPINEFKPFLTSIDDLFLQNTVFIAGDNIKPTPLYKSKNLFLSSNGCLYKFVISTSSVICEDQSSFIFSPFFKEKSYGIQLSCTNSDRNYFSDVLMKTLFLSRSILSMTDGVAYALHYNFPGYLIELAKVFKINFNPHEPYQYLYSQLTRLSVTQPILKNILKMNETKQLLEYMRGFPFLKTLRETITENRISSLLNNDESFLCFDVFCEECKSVSSCPHSFLCSITNLNDGKVVGFASMVDTPFEQERENNIFGPLESKGETQPLKFKSEGVRESLEASHSSGHFSSFKEDSGLNKVKSTSSRKIEKGKEMEDKEIKEDKGSHCSVGSTPLSGMFYQSKVKSDDSMSFVCDLVINGVQPIQHASPKINVLVVVQQKKSEPLKLVQALRKDGYVTVMVYKENLMVEDIDVLSKQYNTEWTIVYNDGLKLLENGKLSERKTLTDVMISVKSGKKYEVVTYMYNKVDMMGMMLKEDTANALEEKVYVTVISFETEDVFNSTSAEIVSGFENARYMSGNDKILVILKNYDHQYVNLVVNTKQLKEKGKKKK